MWRESICHELEPDCIALVPCQILLFYKNHKVNALKRYEAQSSREYFNEDYFKARAYARGINIGIMFTEVFECIRIKI